MYIHLRHIRKQQKKNGVYMADLLGYKTKGAYYKKESGNVPFTLSEAKTIANDFGMIIDKLFFGGEVGTA